MKHLLSYPQKKRLGYTLVELAVVIAAIGILATITIFAFGSWRESVALTEVKNDMTNVAAAMKNAKNWGTGYPTFSTNTVFDGSNSSKSIYIQSPNITIKYRSGSATTYCIDAVSTVRSTIRYFVDVATTKGEVKQGSCAEGEIFPGTWSIVAGTSTYSYGCTGSCTWEAISSSSMSVAGGGALTPGTAKDLSWLSSCSSMTEDCGANSATFTADSPLQLSVDGTTWSSTIVKSGSWEAGVGQGNTPYVRVPAGDTSPVGKTAYIWVTGGSVTKSTITMLRITGTPIKFTKN
jgi:prepilin-type N-terminal cleavage/methylation domain-containing protein